MNRAYLHIAWIADTAIALIEVAWRAFVPERVVVDDAPWTDGTE